MNKITIKTSGSLGPNKTVIRDEVSWIRSVHVENKLFNFEKNEVFAAACGSNHSLYKYVKFRSQLVNSLFIDDRSKVKTDTENFSTKFFVKNITYNSPTVIYTLPNIFRVICKFLKKNIATKNLKK